MALPRKHLAARPAVKAMPPYLGNFWGGFDSGWGRQPWVPGARMDFARLAGNLRDNSVVSICLAWLRRQVGQGTLCVGTEDADGTRTPIPDHPLLNLLKRPNPVWGWTATLGGLTDALGVDGNGYLNKARDGLGRVREVYWLPNYMVQLVYDPNPEAVLPIKEYLFIKSSLKIKPYVPQDIVHFRNGIDPERPAKGLSDLQRQIRNIASLGHGERYGEAVLRKGHAGTVMVPKEPVTPGYGGESPDEVALRKERDRMEDGMSAENAGRIHVATMPVELLNAGLTPEQMMLDRILDRPEAMVVAAMGLNSLVLGLPSSHDSRTYSNYAEARRDAWESAVIPLQDLIADHIQHQLLYTVDEDGQQVPEFDGDPDGLVVWWDRSHVAALREDANERANRTQLLFTSTALPRNRALAESGFDPVDGPDGDLYYGDATERATAAADEAIERQQVLTAEAGEADAEQAGEPEPDPTDEPTEKD